MKIGAFVMVFTNEDSTDGSAALRMTLWDSAGNEVDSNMISFNDFKEAFESHRDLSVNLDDKREDNPPRHSGVRIETFDI